MAAYAAALHHPAGVCRSRELQVCATVPSEPGGCAGPELQRCCIHMAQLSVWAHIVVLSCLTDIRRTQPLPLQRDMPLERKQLDFGPLLPASVAIDNPSRDCEHLTHAQHAAQ